VEKGLVARRQSQPTETLFEAIPYFKEPNHFWQPACAGERISFVTMGDGIICAIPPNSLFKPPWQDHAPERRWHGTRRQSISKRARSTRRNLELWHRNPQGLVFNASSGDLWEHEHGPKGGDEVNLIKPGVN